MKTQKTSRFGNAVKNMGKLWGGAKEKAASSKGGNYIEEPMAGIFRLTNAEVATIGANKWLHAAFEFTCVSEEFQGQIHNHRCGLDNEDSLSFLIRDLQRLGVDTDQIEVDSIDELEELLKELVKEGPCVRAQLVQQKDSDYLNMRIKKLVESEPFDGDSEGGEEEEEEETPKTKKGGKTKPGTTTGKPKAELVETFEAGDEIEYTGSDKKRHTAIVMKHTGANSYKVKDGKVVTVIDSVQSKATKVEAEEEAEEGGEEEIEISKGTRVQWDYKGKTRTGTVTELVGDEGKIKVKADDDKKIHVLEPGDYELEAEEEESEGEDADVEDIELTKGTKIATNYKGKDREGEVLSVDEAKGTVKAKLTGVPGQVTLNIDDIEVLEG